MHTSPTLLSQGRLQSDSLFGCEEAVGDHVENLTEVQLDIHYSLLAHTASLEDVGQAGRAHDKVTVPSQLCVSCPPGNSTEKGLLSEVPARGRCGVNA